MKLKSILVKPFIGESFTLQSKSSLTPEKVFDILVEDALFYQSLEVFETEIWNLLKEGIIISKHYTIPAYLIPYME